MTNKTRKGLGIVAGAILVVGMAASIPFAANALTNNKTIEPTTLNQVVYQDPDDTTLYAEIKVNELTSKVKDVDKIKHLKSSNKEIDVATSDASLVGTEEPIIYLIAEPDFEGSTTISFKVDGKEYSTDFTAYAYENPVESLTLSGKDFTKQLDDTETVVDDIDTTTDTNLNVKTKDGWQLTKLEVIGDNVIVAKNLDGTTLDKDVGNFEYVQLTFTNEETGGTELISIANNSYESSNDYLFDNVDDELNDIMNSALN